MYVLPVRPGPKLSTHTRNTQQHSHQQQPARSQAHGVVDRLLRDQAGGGNDLVFGGGSRDTLSGGAGDDTIALANTTASSDTVVFSSAIDNTNGEDTITGFLVGGTNGDILKFTLKYRCLQSCHQAIESMPRS